MMLKAFPSSQSTISADTARVYLFAVEDFTLAAVKRACRMFVKREISGRNHAFAPSAPELVDACEVAAGKIRVEEFEAGRVFIAEGSEQWQQMQIHRGHSLPTFVRDGKPGWFFTKKDAEQAALVALPPPLSEAQMQINAVRAGALLGSKTFNAADDDSHDMGGERVA
jgi:predicted DNA-binding protein (UPF0251 family)